MRAAVYRGESVVSVEEIPTPAIGRGEILVRVEACGICHTDLKKIEYNLLDPPRIYGHETAGVVAAVGCDVTRFRPGDRVARTAEEKRILRTQGASAVEMEAAGVASRAEALGLPFYCVRAVTDLAGEDMANDFNKALRPDGHFGTMRIFSHALRHPVARLPELIRLRQHGERAARALGEFFADCRF